MQFENLVIIKGRRISLELGRRRSAPRTNDKRACVLDRRKRRDRSSKESAVKKILDHTGSVAQRANPKGREETISTPREKNADLLGGKKKKRRTVPRGKKKNEQAKKLEGG